MYALNAVKMIPCPASPNITPNRNGNVIIVYKAKINTLIIYYNIYNYFYIYNNLLQYLL